VARLATTERFRYVVGYVIEPSFAFELNRSLETGDKLVVGYGEPDLENDMADGDGWFFIHTPDQNDDEVEVAEYRAGEKKDSEVVTLEKAITIWKRLAIDLNWYNVGEATFTETYTNDGRQVNAIKGRTSVDDGKGPEFGNAHVTFAIERGSSSSELTLTVGSVAVQTLGEVTALTRDKSYTSISNVDAANTWVPIQAIRVAPTENALTFK